MPYTMSDYPAALKGAPKHMIEIWIAAFNSAFKQYNGDEGKSAATAWNAIKSKYEKKGDEWVAKESRAVRKYITKNISTIRCPDCGGDRFDIQDNLYKCLSCGVLLESKESEEANMIPNIIQEAGKRGKTQDPKVQKVVEGKADEAEIQSVMEWLKLQEVMKTEDGVEFPASAFAYAPSEKPSEWKLRLWEDTTLKVTRKQLGAASAALSPGGFRGQKVQIPSEDLSSVKRKIRSAYRSLDVSDEDMPRWVKETETRELISSFVPLTEAQFDKGRATVIVIKPGFNTSEDRYYPAEMLKRDYKVFEGMKMYADHPTEAEDSARPERSIKDWVATLSNVTCDENGVVTGVAEVIEPWLMNKLASLRDKKMLSEMGISINAVGSASKGKIDGKETLVIEKLVAARSVDFVTEPGAGGVVTFYESNRNDIDLIDLGNLKEKRPDLVKMIETSIRAEIQTEVKKKVELEEKVKELEGQITTLTTERDALKTQMTEAEKAQKKAAAQAAIKEAVEKAELPVAAKEKLMSSFKDAETAEGITEAIKAEADYIAKLSESGKVKNMGDTKIDPAKSKADLKDSFKRLGMSDKEAEIAAGR